LTKINDAFRLKTILEWASTQKWMKDAIIAQEEENGIDTAVQRELKERESEWCSGSLAVKREKYKALLKEIRAKCEEVE
jgi:hypothetical protein